MMRNISVAQIFVDGGIGESHTSGNSGIGVIACTPQGYFLGWESQQLGPMTNNEAEYEALILGLKLGLRLGLKRVEFVSDSQVVVWQMQGRSRVNSPHLRPLHQQACQLAARFAQACFCHVGREENQMADALASHALLGQVVKMPAVSSRFARLFG